MQRCNQNIVKAIDLAESLSRLAEAGEVDSTDDGCAVLYGVVRDCAYKIRGRAEREREVHRAQGRWYADADTETPTAEPAGAHAGGGRNRDGRRTS